MTQGQNQVWCNTCQTWHDCESWETAAELNNLCGFWHPGNYCPEDCPICGLPVVSGNPAGACQCQPEDFEFFLEG